MNIFDQVKKMIKNIIITIIMFEKEKSYISHYFSEEFIKAVERYENLVHFSIRENQKFRDSKTSHGP